MPIGSSCLAFDTFDRLVVTHPPTLVDRSSNRQTDQTQAFQTAEVLRTCASEHAGKILEMGGTVVW